MTDTLFDQSATHHDTPVSWVISYEVIAWAILLIAALVIRVAEIDNVPLSDREALPAVAAWHLVHADAPGTPAPVSSPVVLWGQTASFALLGGTEFAARLPTVLASLGLLLLPLALRRRWGRDKAFLLALLLACSPIGITASRTSDPAVWTALFGGGLLLALWNYAEYRRASDVTWVALLAAGLVLSGPGGLVLGLVLGLSVAAASAWLVWSSPQDLALEQPSQAPFAPLGAAVNEFPWSRAGFVFLAVLVTAGTGFMLLPHGINQIGNVIGGFVSGFWSPSVAFSPIGAGLVNLLIFDPLLIVFAIIGVIVLVRQERFGLRERFIASWVLIGLLFLLAYRGNPAGAALWVVVPLALLAVEGIAECFVYRRALLYIFNEELDDDALTSDQYRSLKWITAVIVIALLVMIGLHTQEVGRGLLLIPQSMSFSDALAYLRQPAFSMTIYSTILLLVLIGFLIVGFFLAASIWGNANTLQGYGLGLMIVMLVSGVGGGWKATTLNATAPGELWQPTSVSQGAFSFRETLFDLAVRQTRGYPELSIVIVTNPEQGIDDSGLMAWWVRNYPKTRFVNDIVEAKQQEIVITGPVDKPDLGGTYVGQSFILRTYWTLDDISPVDALGWFTLRTLRPASDTNVYEKNSIVLWVRSDVYTHSTAE